MKKARTFEIYRSDKDNLWYWRCKHRNGKQTADGSEGYRSRSGAARSLTRLIDDLRAGNYVVWPLSFSL